MRPDCLAVVLGTGTDIGKTWVAATVLARLRAEGVAVAVRKPVQSFPPCDVETDAHVLALATGEQPDQVCPPHRWYGAAMAPPMAAAFVGQPPFTLADLMAELTWPAGVAVGVVETAGGPRSPVADDGDSVDVAAAVEPDLVVLVSAAGLGAINAVRLSAAPIRGAVRAPLVVYLNRFSRDDVDRRNLYWLRADGFDVVTTPEELAARLRPPPA